MVLVLALGDLHIPSQGSRSSHQIQVHARARKDSPNIMYWNSLDKGCPFGDLESLAMLQRQLEVDILVTGHTHQFKAYKHEGGVVINPGSATAAFISITEDVNPSFVLMDIDDLHIVVYVYKIIEGEVKVDKIYFKKTAATLFTH